jgi:DNA-binding NtrC family response regulator
VPERILVIDDAEPMVESFRDLLTDEGYEVITRTSAPADAAEVARMHPNLLIVDYLIGEEPVRWHLLEDLGVRSGDAGLPVIVCTAAPLQAEDLPPNLRTGSVRLIAKPFAVDDMLHCIAELLAAQIRGVNASRPVLVPAS